MNISPINLDPDRRSSDAYDRFSRTVDGPMLVLAILWLPVLIWPLVAHPSPTVKDALAAIDYTVWALFSVEYLVKLYLAPQRWRFVRTHVLDLVVIAVPMFRPLRAFRLVRLANLGRVAIVGGEVVRRAKSILTHRGLHFVFLAVVILVFISAALEKAFEAGAKGSNIHTYADSLWWAVVTLTTVGYGDRFPVSAAGRGVAVVLMLLGIGLMGVITATLASYFITQERDKKMEAVEARLASIETLLEAQAAILGAVGGAPAGEEMAGISAAGC